MWLSNTSKLVVFVGGGGYGGDRGGGDRGGGDMVTQEDTVFVQGMNPDTTEDELCQHFGAIGIIKVNLMYLNNKTQQIIKHTYKLSVF